MIQKTITNASHFLSFAFSPLLVPTYGVAAALWGSVLIFIPTPMKWRMLGVMFFLTAVVPASVILLLKMKGVVSDLGLNVRRERPIPYCVVCLAYLASAWMFRTVGFPIWLSLFMCGAALATFLSLVINVWWKISAHMAAMGGMLGLMLRILAERQAMGDVIVLTLVIVLFIGLVGSARVWLGRHTVAQVYAGTLNGVLCVYLISGL